MHFLSRTLREGSDDPIGQPIIRITRGEHCACRERKISIRKCASQ
jgi:hypothetical protein